MALLVLAAGVSSTLDFSYSEALAFKRCFILASFMCFSALALSSLSYLNLSTNLAMR